MVSIKIGDKRKILGGAGKGLYGVMIGKSRNRMSIIFEITSNNKKGKYKKGSILTDDIMNYDY